MGLLWGHDEKTCPECGMKIPSSARRCPYCLEDFGDNSLFDDIHEYGCLGLPVIGLIILGCFWLIGKCSNPHIESSPANNVSYSGSTSQMNNTSYSSSESRTGNDHYYSNSTLPKAYKYKVKVKRAPAYNSKGEILNGRFYDKGTIVEGYSTTNGFVMVVHSSGRRLKSSGVYLKISDVKPLR